MPFALDAHQVPQYHAALASLKQYGVFLDSSCTGAGKTYIAVAVAAELKRPTLVITPKPAITQWKRIMESAGYKPLAVINPEALVRSRKNKWYDIDAKLWRIPKDTLVIFDEPHRGASGPESATTFALARLKAYKQAGISLYALTATLADSPLKLKGMGYWFDLHDFTPSGFTKFCEDRGCFWKDVSLQRTMTVTQGGVTSQIKTWDLKPKLTFTMDETAATAAMLKIKAEIGSRMLGLQVADIPGFPEQVVEILYLDLNTRERKEIDEAYAEMDDRLRTNASTEMAQINRLRERVEFIKADAMVEHMEMSRDRGYSVVAFTNFISVRQRLLEKLKLDGTHTICGGQSDADRMKAQDSFQDNTSNCIIVATQAGGVALSLHDVHHVRQRVSYITPSFRSDELVQTLGRIRRSHGTSVTQYISIAVGTVEEKVAAKLNKKLRCVDTINASDVNPFTKD